jgi:TolB-like protein
MGKGMSPPERSAINDQLARLLASGALAGSEQLKRFLSYTTERALAGDGGNVKEYLLGVEVFGRSDSYDPRIDPIVRVQARRLRAKLDEYYRTEGRADPIRFDLPKGGYVPVFEPRAAVSGTPAASPFRAPAIRFALAAILVAAAAAAALLWISRPAAGAPVIAVLPIVNLSGDPAEEPSADKLTEAIITELARAGGLRVKSRTTVMRYKGARRPLPEIARELAADVVFEGGYYPGGGRIYLKARLVNPVSDTKVWADTFERPAPEIVALARDAAQAIAGRAR